MRSFRFALRSLLKSPGFTGLAVLTIAVGIAANTALFSVFDRLILDPVSLPHPSNLVSIWSTNSELNFSAASVSWPRYEAIRRDAESFGAIGISATDSFTLTDNGDPQQLQGLRVSASFFPTLGVTPARGRNFLPEEDAPGGVSVVILSHELWQTQFGGRSDIVGSTISLNGASWEVIGVMPPRLSRPWSTVQIFAPRVFEVSTVNPEFIRTGAGYAQPIGRLRPGVSLAGAQDELAAISRAYAQEFGTLLDAKNLSEPRQFVRQLTSNVRPTFHTLLAAVAFVLLIGCANVASLFLSRLSARQKEIAVRQSLGATRASIVGQFLAESLLFSAAAGALGLFFSLWALAAIQSVFGAQLSPGIELGLDGRALAFNAGVTLGCALLVGLAPAWQASKTALVDVLKDATRGSTGAHGGRFRSILIVTEVALSVVLLVGAGLLLLNFLRLQQTSPGFDTEGVAGASVTLPSARYPSAAQQVAFFSAVTERLRADPRVASASNGLILPLSGSNPLNPYSVSGRAILPLAQRPLAGFRLVHEDYFETLQIPLLEGRQFTSRDRDGSPGVAIVNESFARRVFPGESAVGKVLLRGPNADIPHEIVGVVRDIKSTGLTQPPPDEIYYPMRQLVRPNMVVMARTTGDADPAILQGIIRGAVAEIDREQSISVFATMTATLMNNLGTQRIVATLTAIFAAVALLLAAVGLYSVLAYAVSQRTVELGIRLALGAQRTQVVALVMRGGFRLVGIGLLLGLAAAAVAGRVIEALLVEVRPFDPVIYAGVTLLFLVVAALACFIPSLRASRVDPLVALRGE